VLCVNITQNLTLYILLVSSNSFTRSTDICNKCVTVLFSFLITNYDHTTVQTRKTFMLHSPIYMDIPGLTNSMTTILSLRIHRRIPITVIKYHSVCTSEVHTNTTWTSWQDEAKNTAISIKTFHQNLETNGQYQLIIICIWLPSINEMHVGK